MHYLLVNIAKALEVRTLSEVLQWRLQPNLTLQS